MEVQASVLRGNNLKPPMSALGQKQTFGKARLMSALPPKADIGTIPAEMGLLHLIYKSVTVRIGGRAISMENLRLRQAAPTSVNVTVGQRSREYLTEREVERLIEAAKQNRSGHRDATAILVAYRHG